jgi:hypothetical protein
LIRTIGDLAADKDLLSRLSRGAVAYSTNYLDRGHNLRSLASLLVADAEPR